MSSIKINIKKYLLFSLAMVIAEVYSQNKDYQKWEEGYFDIHHIYTSLGDATFFVFPDETTLLYDAGGMKESKIKGTSIKEYISLLGYDISEFKLDYAVISHFHPDHYGLIKEETPFDASGNYQLSGITQVGDWAKIGTLMDRDYPDYKYPVSLFGYTFRNLRLTFQNYLKFQKNAINKKGINFEKIKVGDNKQIRLNYKFNNFPSFYVRNVKSNQFIWDGIENGKKELSLKPGILEMNSTEDFSENSLSVVLQFNYGKFDYLTGGDLLGFNQNMWGHYDYDFETPIAKVLREVDAIALNHHGYKDANNTFFLKTLSPLVVVQQSKGGGHFSPQLWLDLLKFNIDSFALYLDPVANKTDKEHIKNPYISQNGHVLIRVYPEGEKFKVLILKVEEDSIKVVNEYGPYFSRL